MSNVLGLSQLRTREGTPLFTIQPQGAPWLCARVSQVMNTFIPWSTFATTKERPLFLAALHGHMETFLFLHCVSIRSPSTSATPWRRKGGDTILHSNLARECFGDISHHHLAVALINFSLIKYSYFLFDLSIYSILTHVHSYQVCSTLGYGYGYVVRGKLP